MGLIVLVGAGAELAAFWAAACLIEGRSLLDDWLRLVVSDAFFLAVGILLLIGGASPAAFFTTLLVALVVLARGLLGASWIAAFGGSALALAGGVGLVIHRILSSFYAQWL